MGQSIRGPTGLRRSAPEDDRVKSRAERPQIMHEEPLLRRVWILGLSGIRWKGLIKQATHSTHRAGKTQGVSDAPLTRPV